MVQPAGYQKLGVVNKRLNHIRSKLLTRHLCRYAGQLLAQDVVVGVEERQLLHHGLFRNEVENLCDLPIFNNRHASDGVFPLDPVQNDNVIAGAADPAEAAEVEEA